jgi:hypothetical protein
MWDIFTAFILLGAGSILAFYQLRRWFATKRWIHLAAILVAIGSELAILKGFTQALIVLVLALILAFVAENRKM